MKIKCTDTVPEAEIYVDDMYFQSELCCIDCRP